MPEVNFGTENRNENIRSRGGWKLPPLTASEEIEISGRARDCEGENVKNYFWRTGQMTLVEDLHLLPSDTDLGLITVTSRQNKPRT